MRDVIGLGLVDWVRWRLTELFKREDINSCPGDDKQHEKTRRVLYTRELYVWVPYSSSIQVLQRVLLFCQL